MSDDTIKQRARMLLDGWDPYTEATVTERVQSYCSENHDEGPYPEIDDAIEADLKEFFNVT